MTHLHPKSRGGRNGKSIKSILKKMKTLRQTIKNPNTREQKDTASSIRQKELIESKKKE
jgi:hypothetical protein